MRVCFFGLYDPQNPRNVVLRRGFRAAGVEVVECRESLELGDTPSLLTCCHGRVSWFSPSSRCTAPDALFLCEFNQPLALLAAALARKRHIPLVVDFLVSLYDTAVRDRGQSRWRVRSQLLGLADRTAARLADRIITDSEAHARFFASLSATEGNGRLSTSARPNGISRSPLPARGKRRLKVLYFGNLHSSARGRAHCPSCEASRIGRSI